MIEIFKEYCSKDNLIISKELFQKNLELKRLNTDFKVDMNVLLPHLTHWDFNEAFDHVQIHVISKI